MHCFGYPCHLVISGEDDEAPELMQLAKSELERLEAKFSSFEPTSVIGRINQQCGGSEVVSLDAEARSLFEYVTSLWQSTGKTFDPTVSLLQGCYDEGRTPGRVAACVKSRLPAVGWDKMDISADGARLRQAGMFIDLNGIIRPYVVDRVKKLLLQAGSSSALIDLDRDIATIGKQSDGANWMHGMRHPRGTRTAIARLKLNDGAFAIRGDFERCLNHEGETFGRALNPADGNPIMGPVSVAVTADTCLEACSIATVARMKLETEAVEWLEAQQRPWMAIDRQLLCHGPLTPSTAR